MPYGKPKNHYTYNDAYSFLMAKGGKNKSAYINELLKKEKQRTLEEAILKANKEEAEDPDYQEEYSIWIIP